MVEVVAAVLIRRDGQFLLAQRPPGKVYAGWWEFPGGKVEPGEEPGHALARELAEELGIALRAAYPWLTLQHVYPHARVRLNFFRVLDWQGDPHAAEHSALAWQRPGNVTVTPVLPANAAVLRALQLPVVYGVSNAAELGVAAFLARLEDALECGLRLVMVREKEMSERQLEQFSRDVIARCRGRGARVLVNADPVLAGRVGADGVHLSAARLATLDARPDLPWCAASCHDAPELERAARLGMDFVVLGPVGATPSHPGGAGMGWPRFRDLARGCSLPVFAIGGLTPADMTSAWHAGAHGIAMLRAAWPDQASLSELGLGPGSGWLVGMR